MMWCRTSELVSTKLANKCLGLELLLGGVDKAVMVRCRPFPRGWDMALGVIAPSVGEISDFISSVSPRVPVSLRLNYEVLLHQCTQCGEK